MPTVLYSSLDETQAAFEQAGQGHIFRYWPELSAHEQKHLLAQAQALSPELLAQLKAAVQAQATGRAQPAPSLQPAQSLALEPGSAQYLQAKAMGQEALFNGRVCLLTVAGGQGTRLGSEVPKGMLPITPIRNKTLFQVFAEKVQYAQQRYDRDIPWFIMTSPINHEAIRGFFKQNAYFGLSTVHFITQGTLPAMDPEGKLILEHPASIALSPNGHGGLFEALARHQSISYMRARCIDTVSYIQIDNPLVHCLDPVFIGAHLMQQSDYSSKVIDRKDPHERVGVFCRQDDTLRVIEYSHLHPEQAQALDAQGRLAYGLANIAVHLLSVPFLESLTRRYHELPLHIAHKKVATYDPVQGKPCMPAQPNAYKFERFLFDALPWARNPLLLHTRREAEFSPVKNAQGHDSFVSCQHDQLRLHAQWLQAARCPLPVDASGLPLWPVEISPLCGACQDEFMEYCQQLPSPLQVGPYMYLGP
jgi:UDP-N-acetylglucosamine/UDP-N-acetylgalactosamine diphosphorylase